MIDYLASAENVLAVRIRNALSREEIDGLIERLKQKIETCEKTHVFVEIDSFPPEAWKHAFAALPRSLELFRLSRYGRVAVVSDDKFVRGWSRIESAMLPGIHYEIFHAAEAERALQWVEGKIAMPHEAALRLLETNNPLVLAYAIDGTPTKSDLDQLIAAVQPRLDRQLGPISVLARVGELLFSEPASLFEERYFSFKKAALSRVERYAVVGGPAWLRLMVKATAPFMPFTLRYFDAADEKEAWDWVGASEAKAASAEPARRVEVTA